MVRAGFKPVLPPAQNATEPMIYLIGGPPRCGKTIIAKALDGSTHVPWFPVDYLSSLVSQYVPEQEYQARFPLGFLRRQQDRSNDKLYSQHSPAEIVGFYQTQTETVWPGLRAFLEYAGIDRQDFVLEGYQIQPRMIHSLRQQDYYGEIEAVFIYRINESEILDRLKYGNPQDNWVAQNTKNEGTLSSIARMVSGYGEYFQSEAQKYGFPSFNMDKDFGGQTEAAIRSLVG